MFFLLLNCTYLRFELIHFSETLMIIFHPFGIIGVIISVLIYFVYKHIRLRKILKPVPSVRSLPFIGHVHITKPDVEGFVDQIMGVANLFPDAPRMVTFWAGTIPSVMVYSADLVGAIAANSSHLNKGIFYDLLKPWLGCGLLTRFGRVTIIYLLTFISVLVAQWNGDPDGSCLLQRFITIFCAIFCTFSIISQKF